MNSRTTLGDVATIVKGVTPAHTTSIPESPLFIGQTEVMQGRNAPKRYVDVSETFRESLPVMLEFGDLVLASLDRSHETLIIDDQVGAVLGRDCLAVRVNPNSGVSTEFIAAWLETESFRSQMASLESGTRMPRVTRKALAEVKVPSFTPDQVGAIVESRRDFESALHSVEKTLATLRSLKEIEMGIAFAKVT